MNKKNNILFSKINWNILGLVPVIVQDYISLDILMFAWMNKESLLKTIKNKQVFYWSRSRNKIWYKGETSGCYQKVISLFLDCDNDVILLKIIQILGISCHTGRRSCFYKKFNLKL